jgi:hypothetical protein
MSTKQKISYNLSQLYAGMDSLGFSDIYVTKLFWKVNFEYNKAVFLNQRKYCLPTKMKGLKLGFTSYLYIW